MTQRQIEKKKFYLFLLAFATAEEKYFGKCENYIKYINDMMKQVLPCDVSQVIPYSDFQRLYLSNEDHNTFPQILL
jgi:hypothetical protein